MKYIKKVTADKAKLNEKENKATTAGKPRESKIFSLPCLPQHSD